MSDEHTRRGLLRWIIAATIGIPVLIEVGTFLGLVGAKVGDEHPNALDEGDELLPSTPAIETVRTIRLERSDGGTTFRFVVEVSNTTETPYGVAVTGLTLDDGTSLSESVETGPIRPGDRSTLRGEWALPSGAIPVSITAIARTYDGGSSVVAAKRHRLAATFGDE